MIRTSNNAIELKKALITALIPVYLRTFGGYKIDSDYPTKEEMADFLISQMGEYYVKDNEIKDNIITGLKGLGNNVVVKYNNQGYSENEILFPGNLVHFSLSINRVTILNK